MYFKRRHHLRPGQLLDQGLPLEEDFQLKKISKVGTGLGLGSAGHTVGSAKALQLGSIEGAMASVAVVIVSLAMDILVPIYVNLFMK